MFDRTNKRLKKAYENAKQIEFDDSKKFVLFSDCHRGDGSWADDFAHNANLFSYALDYYSKEFTYIEVGDGDELWENSNFKNIAVAHRNIFSKMNKFYEKGHLYLIWGNHNRKWKSSAECQKNLSQYYDERDGKDKPLFKGITVHEGLILRYQKTGHTIFIIHGHQADFFNSCLRGVSRFFVRNFWKFFQLGGVKDPTGPAKNFKQRKKIEKKLTNWAEKNKQMLIAGHTHRSVFPAPGKSPYFNTGSCVHPRCIVGIEIEKGNITLVKWHINVKQNNKGGLFIDREELVGPKKLEDFFNRI